MRGRGICNCLWTETCFLVPTLLRKTLRFLSSRREMAALRRLAALFLLNGHYRIHLPPFFELAPKLSKQTARAYPGAAMGATLRSSLETHVEYLKEDIQKIKVWCLTTCRDSANPETFS